MTIENKVHSGAESYIRRIMNDIKYFQSQKDHLACLHVSEEEITKMTALLIGPTGTPYENGLFQVALKFPPNYPLVPPAASFLTTNNGRCRFNPNFYADGKVCL